MSISAAVLRVFFAAVVMMSLVSCDQSRESESQSAEQTFANWPRTLDGFRFRWSADPGIDLLTGPAVPLRAYLESHRVGDMTFDANDAYPGFDRAVPQVGKAIDESRSDLPFELWGIQPATEPALAYVQPTNFYGNEYFHVLDLTPIEGGGYRAFVCDGLYNVFVEQPQAHEYEPVYELTDADPDPDPRAVKVWRVELTDKLPPAGNTPSAVTVPQEGPNPAPLGDVFGPWRITGASPDTSWGATDGSDPNSGAHPRLRQMREQCYARMPHNAAQRHAIYTSRLQKPPAMEPAVPGWPGDTA